MIIDSGNKERQILGIKLLEAALPHVTFDG